jgi:DinB superfamily
VARFGAGRIPNAKGVDLSASFSAIATDLKKTVTQAKPFLDKLSSTDTACRPSLKKWSKNEILGHLLDSASNNHQRFVRAALQGELDFPRYEEDSCVELQKFNDLEWKFLVEYWTSYNIFLAHLIGALPDNVLAAPCRIGDNPPVTLAWLAEDYVAHLKHHLKQIVGEEFDTTHSSKA